MTLVCRDKNNTWGWNVQKGCVNQTMSYLNSRMHELISDGTDKQEVSTQDNYLNEMVAMTTALKYET